MKSFDPMEGESSVAFRAFACYRDLGADRSQDAVAKMLGVSRQNLQRWTARWEWVRRAKEYDAHLDSLGQKARERALTKKAEDWAAKEMEMAALLYDKAKSMLAFPLARQKSKDGMTIVEPAEWRMRDAASIAEAGVKMERLARGEATDRVALSIAAKEALQSILTETGLSEDKARQIVSERFGIPEEELVSKEVM